MARILIGAHRGAMCHAPENTLAGFETAIAMKTHRIEFDVRRCKSGEIVVMHDETLDRTTNASGRVAEMTLAELAGVRAGGREPIPTLEQTLAMAKGRVKLLVEIKEAGLAADVVRLIDAAGMVGDCTISSFVEAELLATRAIEPRLATAYFHTTPGPLDPRAVIDRLGVSFLVVWARAADAQQLAAAKRCGLHIRTGFADNLTYEQTFELFRRMVDMGVDEIACGRPDWVGRMIEAYPPAQ